MIKYINYFLICLLIITSGCEPEEKDSIIENSKYYGKDSFLLEGVLINDSLNENKYNRLPISYKDKVREAVWSGSKATAGLSIRFFTNSASITAKWKLLHNSHMDHMAETGIKGIDLYYKNNGIWQYINTGRPSGEKYNEAILINNMNKEMREFKIYLPLYDGIEYIKIGINPNSSIKKPPPNNKKPIVFYGTSITQGGCASRTGMAHTNIISRKLDVDCINFGFDSNGKMEKPIAELISNIDASIYVIDCLPNMTPIEITNNTISLVDIIRKEHANTPIIFADNLMFESSHLDKSVKNKVIKRNTALKNQYNIMIDNRYTEIYYIDNNNAIGTDHEGTVDGVHFTDLGFSRYADYLISKFYEFNLISKE